MMIMNLEILEDFFFLNTLIFFLPSFILMWISQLLIKVHYLFLLQCFQIFGIE